MKDYMQSHSYRYVQLCIYMLFLLRENNVQACVFHVECNAAWDLSHHLTVDFLLFMFKFFDMHPNVILVV